jgi:hypothetical protein
VFSFLVSKNSSCSLLLLLLFFINLLVAAAQVPITKPIQKHIYDIPTVQVHGNETLKRKDKNNMANKNNR